MCKIPLSIKLSKTVVWFGMINGYFGPAVGTLSTWLHCREETKEWRTISHPLIPFPVLPPYLVWSGGPPPSYCRWNNSDEFSPSQCNDSHYPVTKSHTRLTLQQQVCSDRCCILSKEFHQIIICKCSIPPLLFPVYRDRSIVKFNT